MVISDNTIFKLSKDDIIKLLDKKKLYKYETRGAYEINSDETDDEPDTENQENNYGQYDYLLKMRFDLFTKKNVMKLKDLLDKKNKIYDELFKLSIKEMWISDLSDLKKLII